MKEISKENKEASDDTQQEYRNVFYNGRTGWLS